MDLLDDTARRLAWLPRTLPSDTYFMSGYDGQYVVVIPSKQLVICRLGFTKEDVTVWDPALFFGEIVKHF